MYMNNTYLNLMLGVPLLTFPLPVCLLAGKCQASSHLNITRNRENDTQEQAKDLWLPTYIDRWV